MADEGRHSRTSDPTQDIMSPKVGGAAQEGLSEAALKTENMFFSFLLVVTQVAVSVKFAVADFKLAVNHEDLRGKYGYFRDVSIMIFFGFGYLMTFLRRYGYSAIGYCMIVSAVCIEVSLPLEHDLFGITEPGREPHILLENLMGGLFCAGAVMISYGAILGKATPSQLVLMGLLESVFYWLNNWVVFAKIEAHDVGGGMVIHTFGAYFGLVVTRFMTNERTRGHKDNCASYGSDHFSLAGTLFLWLLWPSFNAAVAGDVKAEALAIGNTFVSLVGCLLGFAVASRLVAEQKFDIVHLQNASLAGGVVMGVIADIPIGVHTASLCGFFAGALSSWGYAVLTPRLSQFFNIQDICGVNNLHGMPGLLGSIIGIVVMEQYGGSAVVQAKALGATLGFALVGGAFTGAILVAVEKFVVKVPAGDYFNDRTFWNLPSDYDFVVDDGAFAAEQARGSHARTPGDHAPTPGFSRTKTITM